MHTVKGTVRGRDGTSTHAVERDLDNVVRKLSIRCRAGTHKYVTYRQRLIVKGAGKPPREISIPSVRDRIVLRAHAELLATVFPECAGKLPQTAVAEVASQLKLAKYDSFVRIDVQSFYPSVNHDVLLSEIRKRIRKKEILRLIRGAIATPTAPDHAPRPRALLTSGVPQGLSISNLLAEIYMLPVDEAMRNMIGVSYHRFVDDILILCNVADAIAADELCRAELSKVQLAAHPPESHGKSEIGAVTGGFGYLGYIFTSNGVSVRNSSVVKLEAHLARIHAAWREDIARSVSPDVASRRFLWHRNLAITGCVFQGAASGWIQYFRQMNDHTLLKRLDATVDRLSKRYSVPAHPRPKRFMRAYWVVNHPRSRDASYTPNFDRYSLAQMQNDLNLLGTDTLLLSDQQIRDTFYRMVSKAVRDLEHDIGDIS